MQKVRLYSSKRIFALFVALSVACSLFIFHMSSEPAAVSADRSGGIADIIAQILVKDFDKLDTSDKEEVLSDIDHAIRKIAHFCIYATLGALFVLASLWYNRMWVVHLLLPWFFGTLYAASDEIHQSFVPGRGPLFSDVLLDSCGILFGVLFVLVLTRVIKARAPQVDNDR